MLAGSVPGEAHERVSMHGADKRCQQLEIQRKGQTVVKAVHKIVVSLAGVLLLVALMVGSAFWSFRQTEGAVEARKHTYDLIVRANALLSELRDAETGQRGYLLTGDDLFLEPYLAVQNGIHSHLLE